MLGFASRLRWCALAAALLVSLSPLFWGCGPSSSHSTPVLPSAGEGGTVGAKGQDFLSSSTYQSLVVEVAWVSSEAPSDYALGVLQTRLQQRCDKPGGITLVNGKTFTSTQTVWSVGDMGPLEAQLRQQHTSGTQAAMFVVYLNGGSDQDTPDSQVVGESYSGTSFAIFKDVARKGAPFVSGSEVEATTLVHEAGHLFGLVNLGAPLKSAHLDSAHPFHCTNPLCVMYWEAESSSKTVTAGAKTPDDFDLACLQDLQANGGR
jgi:hypothetical protein